MRNSCAQRALAQVLGARPEAVYRRHPPDTPFALLGTTPWGLARMARKEGLRVAAVRGEAALRRALREDGHVVVLFDHRRLDGRFGYHWAVAREAGGGLLVDGRVVPWPAFLRAWRSWMPGAYREAALHLRRRSTSAAATMTATPAAMPRAGTALTARAPEDATPNSGS